MKIVISPPTRNFDDDESVLDEEGIELRFNKNNT